MRDGEAEGAFLLCGDGGERGGEAEGVFLIGGSGKRLSTFVDDDDNSPAPLYAFCKEGVG